MVDKQGLLMHCLRRFDTIAMPMTIFSEMETSKLIFEKFYQMVLNQMVEFLIAGVSARMGGLPSIVIR